MWALKPQTEIKHKLLTGYLGRWIPILAQRRRQGERIVYIDGFSGPGRYSKGEPGSPLLVLQVALEHPRLDALLARPRFEMAFTFIDMDRRTCDQLGEELEAFASGHRLPAQFRIDGPIHGEFNEHMNRVLDTLNEQRVRIEPAFVFIDPFGPTGFPMKLVGRIMRNPSCEVFIRLNYTRLANTFLRRKDMEWKLSELYGSDDWKRARTMASEREKFLISLYEDQLRGVGNIKLVQPFRTVDPTGHVAYFVFGTNNSVGFEEMKEAMWKVDPEGLFRWQASRQRDMSQGTFLRSVADDECGQQLGELLTRGFAHKAVRVAELEEFVRREPGVLSRHLRPALTELELQGRILNVTRPSTQPRRKGTFPPDAIVQFV